MQLHYKFFPPNIYKIVIRGYRRVCAKCLNKSDVEFENQEEEELERIIKYMALKICLYMHSKKHISEKFLFSKEELQDEICYY